MKRKIVSVLLVLTMLLLPCKNAFIATAVESVPACSCGNTVQDLSAHADNCNRKAFCREVSSKTAEELYGLWGTFPTDVRGFVLTYLSWTDYGKYQALSELLKNFTEPEDPADPVEPGYLPEVPMGCICEPKSTFGSASHKIDCPYHFANLTTEEEYIVYITMTSEEQAAALATLDSAKKAAFDAYLAAHPFVHTVSEDGIGVTACDVPAGATVTAEVVDKEFTKELLPSMTMANIVETSLDIKILDANGNPWQPESGSKVMVKISAPDSTVGQKTDFVHILDTSSAIQKGIAKGTVKFKDLSSLFYDYVAPDGVEVTEENVDSIEPVRVEINPELDDAYVNALAAAESLGYEKQIAYEILEGVCIDEGYYTLYTESFSTFSNGSLGSGTYYINHDLTGLSDHTGLGSNWKGFYTSKDKGGQLHGYNYTELGNITVNGGNTVDFIFVKGNVPVSGTITVNGTLNVSLFNSPTQRFWKYHWSSIWESERDLKSSYSAEANTIYRASGNTGALFSVNSSGVLNLSGISNSNRFIIDGKSISAASAIQNYGRVNLDYLTVNNNYSSGNGGGATIMGTSSNTLDHVTFNGCKATSYGGCVYISASSSSTMNSVSFTNGSAASGAAICKVDSSTGSLTLNSCTFTGCTASSAGGGLYLGGSGNNTLTSVTISKCSGRDGPAMLILTKDNSTTTVSDSTFTGNTGTELGGTVRSYGTTRSTATFTNCNVYSNTSAGHGAGFYWNAGGNSKLTIKDCNIYKKYGFLQGRRHFLRSGNGDHGKHQDLRKFRCRRWRWNLCKLL